MIQDARDEEESSQRKQGVLQTRPGNQDIPFGITQRFHPARSKKKCGSSQDWKLFKLAA
jgi:hypothetical protein